MSNQLLLVGSMPLETVEQVFRTVGGGLARHLAYMPDGEVGDRRYWIDGIAYRVLNGHPEIETLRRPAPDADGVERWRPLGVHDQFQFRVKPGVQHVRFGDPGWRLGFTRNWNWSCTPSGRQRSTPSASGAGRRSVSISGWPFSTR